MALLGSGVTFEGASQSSLCTHRSTSGSTCRLSSAGYGRLLQGKLIKPMVCRPHTCLDLNRKQMTWSVQASVDTKASPEIKIERHGTAVLEGVPHLTDWLPDLPTYDSPLYHNPAYATGRDFFVGPYDVVARNVVVPLHNPGARVFFRRAGPSDKVYFKPEEVRACVVTCGGLCPGLNTVIREIVCGLWNQYGVRDIVGIEGGYRGFYARNTVPLNPKIVNDIHKRGGTILGTSRGGHDTSKIVSSIEDRGINQVYIIGGDGTQKGAAAIYKEVRRRGLKVNVTGIPKTIDNDIAVIDRSFGFDTAVEEAQRAINAAHTEAESAENGIGLVKLMGRYSGYIAMYATLASRDVDLCLIPEVPFYLEGEGGLYEFAEKRLRENGHMVIVVAEGAGQELLNSVDSIKKRDASGNPLLLDTGLWLSGKLKDHFRKTNKDTLNLKYIDPTYMIRAIPSNAADNVYCTLLAQFGIHGAMAGYSGFTVGPVNGRHCYIPISRVTEMPNRVNISDRMWARLLSSTNQPAFIDADTKLSQELELKGKDSDPLPAFNTKASEQVELTGKDSDPLPALNTKTSEPVELESKDSVPSPALSASVSQVPASTTSDHEGVNGLSLKGGEQETVQKTE